MSARNEVGSSLLDSIFTGEQPLGPSTLDTGTSRDEAAALFDGNNEVEAVIRRSSPVFLIGRRGSGKTAFLKASANSGTLTANLDSPELIAQMGRTISELEIDASGEFTERIVPLWEACFIAALCSKIWSSYCELSEVDCPESFAFGFIERKSKQGRATQAATQILESIRNARRERTDYASLESLIDETELNGVPLWKARRGLQLAAGRIGCAAIVSLDSLDQYKGIFYRWGSLLTDASLALQGLFRAASRIGRDTKSVYRVRVSFPAELWNYFSALSANPLKDFDNSVVLHWDNKELLSICATRFLKYLSANYPRAYGRLDARVYGGRATYEVFYEFLPRRITNGVGIVEPTLPYLMRHTQLLPRHLIHILNLIFAEQDLARSGLISDEHIRTAVAKAEETIARTVISSFEVIYPELGSVCDETIPYLPRLVLASDLHKIVNQHRRHGYEYSEVLPMLIEAGVLGRYVGSTGLYDKADFEYLHVHRMFVKETDSLCVHPIFARSWSLPAEAEGGDSEARPILPLGSDPGVSGEYRRYVKVVDDS
jgi:hypothetical protein